MVIDDDDYDNDGNGDDYDNLSLIKTVIMILTMIVTMMIVTVLVMLLLCWQLMDGTLIGPIQPKILHTLAFQQYIYNHFVKEKKKRRQVQFVESEGRFLQHHSLIHNNS